MLTVLGAGRGGGSLEGTAHSTYGGGGRSKSDHQQTHIGTLLCHLAARSAHAHGRPYWRPVSFAQGRCSGSLQSSECAVAAA